MRIGVIGINHRSATLAFREQFVRACHRQFEADPELAATLSCVLLPTCHRMEVYFSCDDLAAAHIHLLSHLRKELDAGFEHHVYTYLGSECFLHLARVTAGLDSLVLGESEIQKQVKVAYQSASDSRRLTADMHYLFQKSLKVGKSMRALNELQGNASSIPHIVWSLSESVFRDVYRNHLKDRFLASSGLPHNLHSYSGLASLAMALAPNANSEDPPCQIPDSSGGFDIETCRVLFIGHSEINRRVITQFVRKKGYGLALCTRQSGIAMEQVHLLPWEERLRWQEYDVVVCGTYHDGYLLTLPVVADSRRRLIFDLSVPRTVDPALNLQPHITLLNMDALGELLVSRSQEQQKKSRLCEVFVEQAVHKLVRGFYHKQLARIL